MNAFTIHYSLLLGIHEVFTTHPQQRIFMYSLFIPKIQSEY
jgi:hypothetical protein